MLADEGDARTSLIKRDRDVVRAEGVYSAARSKWSMGSLVIFMSSDILMAMFPVSIHTTEDLNLQYVHSSMITQMGVSRMSRIIVVVSLVTEVWQITQIVGRRGIKWVVLRQAVIW